ncbi:hypothetical protein C4K26_2926 [Pseudomonas chlororaphis]|nr:hypothetical protein C4K26_2926 [Pseudomonas chlororaphis]
MAEAAIGYAVAAAPEHALCLEKCAVLVRPLRGRAQPSAAATEIAVRV